MREGYVEPEDRPLTPPYDDTIDDITDRHEGLDTAIRALRNDCASFNDAIARMTDEDWLDEWTMRHAEVVARHDGEQIHMIIYSSDAQAEFAAIDPYVLLTNYQGILPQMFGALIQAWVQKHCQTSIGAQL